MDHLDNSHDTHTQRRATPLTDLLEILESNLRSIHLEMKSGTEVDGSLVSELESRVHLFRETVTTNSLSHHSNSTQSHFYEPASSENLIV